MRPLVVCGASIGLLLLIGRPCEAADYTWSGGDGLFSDPAKWSPAGSPGPGDSAKFATVEPGTVMWTGPVSNSLMVAGALNGNPFVLALAGHTYTLTNRFYFESDKAASYLVVSNGTFVVPTNTCDVKINAGVAPARLTFADGAVARLDRLYTWRSAVNVESGATVFCNNEVKIGDGQANSVSALNVAGGSLFLTNHLWVHGGAVSTSYLNIASGFVLAPKYLSVGDGAGGTAWGILNLTGGALETSGSVWIGNASSARGAARISGGVWTNRVDLEVAHGGGANAWLDMDGGEIVMPVSGRNFIVANGGNGHMTTGTVSITGGQLTATNGVTVLVANATNGLGRFFLGGDGAVLARDFKVSSAKWSRGECVVTGGLLWAVNSLLVGDNASCDGILTVDQGEVRSALVRIASASGSKGGLVLSNGMLRSSGYFYVGHTGTGTLEVVGGGLAVSNEFSIGLASRSLGLVRQAGGEVVSTNHVKIGDWGGEGLYELSGGTLTCTKGSLLVGNGNSSTGRLSVTGGRVVSMNNLTVANNGQGLTQGAVLLSGGEVISSNTLTLASSTNTTGFFMMTGGDLNASALTVGGAGMGYFTLSNGTALSRGSLSLGTSLTGTGSVTVAGGLLTVKGSSTVGSVGGGALTVTGGALTLENSLTCGSAAGSTGALVLAGGLVSAKSCTVANYGPSSAWIAGGTNTFVGGLTVGLYTQGVMVVSGGSNTVGGDVYVGRNTAASSGRLTVQGGQSSVSGYTDVGQLGAGFFEVAGGEWTTRFLRLNAGSAVSPVPPQSEVRVSGGRLAVSEACYMPDTASITGRLTLAGGVFAVPVLRQHWGKLHVRFDGGTLQATKGDAAFIRELDVFSLTGNGLKVDTAGFACGTSLVLPDAAGERGRFVKQGAGTFTLYAANTFTGPVVVEAGELALGASGLVTLADGCTVSAGALFNLSARDLDFTLPAPSVSHVDGELRLASGRTLTVAGGAALGGTGVVGRVVFEAGATLARDAADGAALLHADECVMPAGAGIALTGYSTSDLRQGIAVVSGASLAVAQGGTVAVTLDGVPQSSVALRVSGGVLTAQSFNPGTLIRVQ